MEKNMVAKLIEALAMLPEGNNSEEDDQLLTVDQTCKLLGVTRWTIARLRKKGKLQSIKLSEAKSGAVRIFRASVRDFLKRYKMEASHVGE